MNKTFLPVFCLALGLLSGANQPALALGGEKTASIRTPVTFDPNAAHEGDADALF